ncbi:Spore germination protein B3 precursor [compost metagenome]
MLYKGLVILVILCLTTGCWDRREMDDLALVMASGIDLTEDGQIEITLQIALPTGIPSAVTAGSSGKRPIVVISGKGNDIQEVLGGLQQQMSRYIYFGHREIFVIGEHCAREGVNQILDLFTRFPETRYNSYVVTAYGATAKEILNEPYQLELIPGLGISKIEASRLSFSVKLDEFLEAFSSPGTGPVTAAIRISSRGKGKESFALDRAAVYSGNQLTGFLPPDEMEVFRWWFKEPYGLGFTIQAEPEDREYKGSISIQTLRSNVKIKTVMKNELPEVTVFFDTTVRLLNNNTRINLSNTKDRILVEKLFSEQLQTRIKSMLARVQKEMKSDVFGIGKEVHNQHPYAWKKIQDRWNDIFPDVPVTIDVDVKIERIGKTQGRSYLRK